MINTNICVFSGRITRDVAMRVTSGTQTPVGKFSIAVRHNRKESDGNYSSFFLDCVLFGNRALSLEKYLTKGREVGVTGKLDIRSYTDKNGVSRKATELIVDDLSLGASPGDSRAQSYVPSHGEEMDSFQAIDDDDLPF